MVWVESRDKEERQTEWHDIMNIVKTCSVGMRGVMHIYLFFFFQAEDGIRDLVRSGGLGDLYKRQVLKVVKPPEIFIAAPCGIIRNAQPLQDPIQPVSYTHLTLPTIHYV